VTFHSMGIRYDDDSDPAAPFSEDRWELYHVADDPSECDDLAASHPAKLRELQDLWWREAGRYGALPLHSQRAFAVGRPRALPERERYVLRRGAAPVPEENAPNLKLRPHRIIARIELPDDGTEGVVVAQGGRFGGYSLYVLDGRLHYTQNFAGIERTTVTSDRTLAQGRHVVGVDVEPDGGAGVRAHLLVDGAGAGAAEIARSTPLRYALAGEGLCCGYDDGTPVSDRYESPFRFTGTIDEVVIDVSGRPLDPDPTADEHHARLTQ